MPCLTGDGSQKRFMAYNAMGCIICKEEEDYNVIEVAMHDTRAQRRRMPHLNDLYRFSMAALGERVGPPQPACVDWQYWLLPDRTVTVMAVWCAVCCHACTSVYDSGDVSSLSQPVCLVLSDGS